MKAIDKNTEFYLNVNGKEVGPLSFEKLVDNGLMPGTLVWWQGASNWVKADSVPELKALLEQSTSAGTRTATLEPSAVEVNELQERMAQMSAQLEQLTSQLTSNGIPVTVTPHAEPASKPKPNQIRADVKSGKSNVHFLFLTCALVLVSMIFLVGLLGRAEWRLESLGAQITENKQLRERLQAAQEGNAITDVEYYTNDYDDEYRVSSDAVGVFPAASAIYLVLLALTWILVARGNQFGKYMSVVCLFTTLVMATLLTICYFDGRGLWKLDEDPSFFISQMALVVLLGLCTWKIARSTGWLKSKQ